MHDSFPDDPALIEAELARERASLAGNIDSLRNSVADGNGATAASL